MPQKLDLDPPPITPDQILTSTGLGNVRWRSSSFRRRLVTSRCGTRSTNYTKRFCSLSGNWPLVSQIDCASISEANKTKQTNMCLSISKNILIPQLFHLTWPLFYHYPWLCEACGQWSKWCNWKIEFWLSLEWADQCYKYNITLFSFI